MPPLSLSSRLVFAAVVVAIFALPAVAQAQTEARVALVIGNSTYREIPLRNPVNDSRAASVPRSGPAR